MLHPEQRNKQPGSTAEHQLQEEMGTSTRADRFYQDQVLGHLNPRMCEFVARQEMFFLSTADGNGECDSTFRAGPPGFLHIINPRVVAYPEYRGNGVMASLGNIQENPHVGLLLLDFFQDRIGLHINGLARLRTDEVMRAMQALPVDPVPGRRPQVWVEVLVQEAYIHCSKHIPRLSKLPVGGGRAWGSDDARRKGGDFFGVAEQARVERAAATGVGLAPAESSEAELHEQLALWEEWEREYKARERLARYAEGDGRVPAPAEERSSVAEVEHPHFSGRFG